MIAVLWGRFDIIQVLCCYGADVNAQDKRKQTALIRAITQNDPFIVNYLCACGADVNIQDNNGWTALKWAVILHRVPMVEQLCRRGTRLDTSVRWFGCVRLKRQVKCTSNLYIHSLLTKQQFKWNVMVLMEEGVLSSDILRYVCKWS